MQLAQEAVHAKMAKDLNIEVVKAQIPLHSNIKVLSHIGLNFFGSSSSHMKFNPL